MKQKNLLLSCFVAILASVFVSSSISYNSSAVSSASMTTDSSITLDIVPTNGGIAIDEATVNVVTTCRNGYNLTLATPNGSNLYLNGDGTGTAAFTAVNGTSTLANSTNKWGYTLTANASSSTVFSPLSATETTLKTTSQTASQTDIDDTFSIYYGAKADNSITPGSYKMANNGALVYYLTMDASCYTVDITYDGNNADAGTTMSIVHKDVRSGLSVNLAASNYKRSGYGFVGWSFDPNAGAKLVDNDSTNNPVVYGPNETATLPSDLLDYDANNDGVVELYAVWIQSQGNLQGWMGCSNLDTATYDSNTGALDLTKNSVTALTDQRDNDTYAVARLADGKCWMIENLRLDNIASHNSDGDLAQNYGINVTYGNFSGLANPESSGFSSTYSSNSLYSNDGSNGTININNTEYPAQRMPRYNNQNTANPVADMTTWGSYSNINSIGNYYTWHAAIADTTAYNTNNQSIITTSICPSGWQLPTGGQTTTNTTANYYILTKTLMGGTEPNNGSNGYKYYSGTTGGVDVGVKASNLLRSYPNNFIYSGYYDGSSALSRSEVGYYWSSTASGTNSSYSLALFNNRTYPGSYYAGGKYSGSSIRCLSSEAQNYTLTYDANGGSGAPTSQTLSANGSATHTVSNTTPIRSGYTFVGWVDEKGNEAQSGGIFRTKDTNAVLYAIWTNDSCNPTATTIGTGNVSTDAVCLQDVKPSMKASLPIANASSGTYSLIDARDGQSYTVAKLADGELWLTKNLNYGNSSDVLLTSYDTDLPSGKTFKAPASTTSFETTDNTNTRISPKILTNSTYGGYYSFAAAIASTSAYSTANQNIATSICPKSWDLPTSAQYSNLRTTSGNTTYSMMHNAPYSFIYAGYRNGTSFTSQTSAIRLWTSTNYSYQYAYYTTSYQDEGYASNYKRYGESVRCVASNGTATVNYNANGGSGTMASQTGDINAMTIKPNVFTAPTNNQFRNWNTRADGTGTTVTEGASLLGIASDGDTITLYAQWDEVYYIAFNANESSVDSSATATGTMARQIVARDVATAIKANTFALTGYIFYGWNTSADGTGTLYSDGQKVTNLTSTGNTITLYAVWVKEALLDTGQTVNQKLKRLAGNSSANYSTTDNSITALVRSNTLPSGFTPSDENTISHSSSPLPIYAWYDSGSSTIYYYSEATDILMNKYSNSFFYEMRALSNLSTITTWDTIKVVDMGSMFSKAGYDASTFTLDLSSWNVSSVTSMYNMFSDTGYNVSSLTLDLSSWNTSNVTNMYVMFQRAGYDASTFTLDLSSWNTSSVPNMSSMFSQAGYSATTWSISGLSSWNTSNVTDMSSMFFSAGYSASTFSLDLSSWNTSSVTTMARMFSSAGHDATSWSIGDLSSWNTSNVTDMSSMFSATGTNATNWSISGLSSWNTPNVTDMSGVFSSAGYSASTFSLDLSSWNTSNVTNMFCMFCSAGYSASSFSLDLSSWNTSNVKNMNQMFRKAGRSATTWSISGLSSWNTPNVTNMSYMFSEAGYSASTFTLDISSLNTSSVTTMSYMFSYAGYSAPSFILDLSSWNTSSVTTIYNMFSYAGYRASTFTLDLSTWNTSGVTDMSSAVYNAGRLATTWSITIPKTNDGTDSGPIANSTSRFYGNTTSNYAAPDSGKSFTLAN